VSRVEQIRKIQLCVIEAVFSRVATEKQLWRELIETVTAKAVGWQEVQDTAPDAAHGRNIVERLGDVEDMLEATKVYDAVVRPNESLRYCQIHVGDDGGIFVRRVIDGIDRRRTEVGD
jgi:hypothetical protein